MSNLRFLQLAGIVALISACTVASEPTRRVAPGDHASNDGGFTAFCSDPTDPCFSFDGTPPPPYVDTTGSLVDAGATPVADAPVVHLQYFFNVPSLSGWVSFRGQTSPNVSVSPNARIMYSRGAVSGRGTVQMLIGSSILTIDLSKAVSSKTSTFGDCTKTCATIGIAGAQLVAKGAPPTTFNGALAIGTKSF